MLLSDVHNNLNNQALLQGQHFPAPSTTIVHCLQSCEQALKPLQAIVEKPQPSKISRYPAMAKLKDGITFENKKKDIASWEARIEYEVNCLHAALGSNSNTLL
jgi:hypothetical protein